MAKTDEQIAAFRAELERMAATAADEWVVVAELGEGLLGEPIATGDELADGFERDCPRIIAAAVEVFATGTFPAGAHPEWLSPEDVAFLTTGNPSGVGPIGWL